MLVETPTTIPLSDAVKALIFRRPDAGTELMRSITPPLTMCHVALRLLDQGRPTPRLLDELARPFLELIENQRMPYVGDEYVTYAFELVRRGASEAVKERLMTQLVRAGRWELAEQLVLTLNKRIGLTTGEVMAMIRFHVQGVSVSTRDDDRLLNLVYRYRGHVGVTEVQEMMSERDRQLRHEPC